MINVNETTQNLYKQDSVPKNLTLTFTNPPLVLTNADIVAGSFELSQILSDEDSLKFGGCNVSQMTITLANVSDEIMGKNFSATMSINGGEDVKLGTFTVNDIKKIEGKAYKTITAVDDMSKLNVDVSAWYNALTFPISIKDFRDSLLTHLNVPFKAVTLVNDSILLDKTLDSNIMAIRMLENVCEANGCFGVIDEYGYFDYVKLSSTNPYAIDGISLTKPIYETNTTKLINGVSAMDKDGLYVATSECDNPYTINDNFVFYNKTTEDILPIIQNVLSEIGTITYTPISRLNIKGLPFLQLGDCITLNADGGTITSYVLKKATKGIQTIKDDIYARGSEKQIQTTNSTTIELQKMKGAVTSVKSDVNGLNLKVEDKVDKGTISSEISLETDKVTISGDRLAINSTNCQLTEDGTLTVKNANVEGQITAKSGSVASFNIQDTTIFCDAGGDTLSLGIDSNNRASIDMRGFYGTFEHSGITEYRGQRYVSINGNKGISLSMTSKMWGPSQVIHPAVEIFNNVGDNDDVPRGMIRVYNTPDGDGDPASDFTEIDGGHIKCDSIRTHSGADLDVLNANLKNARLDFWILINGATVNANTDAVLTLLMGRKFSDYRGYISFYIIPYGEYLRPLGQIPLALFNKFSTIHYASNNYYWVDFEYLSDTTLRVKSQYGGRIYVYINIFHIPPLS